jgi:hypothetical protein
VVHHVFGFDVVRRSNIAFLEANIVIMAAGNAVVLFDLSSFKKRYLFGIDGE